MEALRGQLAKQLTKEKVEELFRFSEVVFTAGCPWPGQPQAYELLVQVGDMVMRRRGRGRMMTMWDEEEEEEAMG